jgi:dephospho-CoA kinase
MLRVGLTGGIASGKSTVANELARRGAVIIDADELAREVVEPGTPGFAAVVRRFGEGVLRDERLDRAALARIVFADPQARRDLERIIHPEVRRRAAEREGALPHTAVVVHVIPLLVETGKESDFDLCVVVDVDRQTQLARLMARRPMSREEAESRIAAQATREQRLAAADIVIPNVGTLTDLTEQVDDLWSDLISVHAGE